MTEETTTYKNILIVHDTDQDGECAKHIAWFAERKLNPEATFTFRPLLDKLNTKYTIEDYLDFDKIIVVDGSLPVDILDDLEQSKKEVLIIDHHMTSIDLMSKLTNYKDQTLTAENDVTKYGTIVFICKPGTSAAKLTWQHYHKDLFVPWVVNMINDWDTWNHNDPQVVPFHYGLDCHDLQNEELWQRMLKGDPTICQPIMNEGMFFGAYWVNKLNLMSEDYGYDKEIDGIRFRCCNAPMNSSYDIEGTIDPDKHDAGMWYWYNGNTDMWHVSFRSFKEGTDVRKLAEKYNGGGHTNAAGCRMTHEQIKEWFN